MSRRLPIFTACNIDGRLIRRVRRTQTGWAYDGRIDVAYQLGEEVYARNAFDRGHMVRRLDPVWGDEESAKRANDDTFHYVNAAPQHEELNQKVWLTLEDEVLDFAAVRGLRLSVMTGPVLRDNDKTYQKVKIPKEFWKIVALVDDDTGELSAAGFILSQGEMIKDFTEVPFVAERSAVYQVPISLIESATGLKFASIGQRDAFSHARTEEAMPLPRALRIRGGGDMLLNSRRG